MKYLISIILIFCGSIVLAQDLKGLQYGAYLKASQVMWQRSITLAEKENGAESFERAMAMYGLLTSTMATKDKETFDAYVDPTVDLLKKISEENPAWGEPKAVLSSVYGLIIAYSPMKGIIYGSRSGSYVDDALEDQPESPLVQKLYASSKLYTPSMFGGDSEKAVVHHKKAIELFEQADVSENWLYLDALVGLAQSYIKTEDDRMARQTLEKAISIEPEFGWAKGILKRMDSEEQ